MKAKKIRAECIKDKPCPSCRDLIMRQSGRCRKCVARERSALEKKSTSQFYHDHKK